MRLVWSPRALAQLENAVSYIAQDDPSAAWRVYDRIVARVDQLLSLPELGPPGRIQGTRELVITDTPYVAVYRVKGDELQIAAVWHSAQSRKRRR
jgi:addiction module RelE/StbE family toxin